MAIVTLDSTPSMEAQFGEQAMSDPDSNAPDIAARGGKHTPGPWATDSWFPDHVIPASHCGRHLGGSIHETENRDEYAQVICRTHNDRHGRGDHVANARLIAAAPDLLAFVKEIANFNPVFAKGDEKDRIRRARELVAKAEVPLKAREA